MRCEKCNVDLPESYGLCPLCGGKPSSAKARIAIAAYVPYPKEDAKEEVPFEKEKTAFSAEKLKAYFNL